MGYLRTLSTRGNVDTESLAAPSDSNWSVRFQETGDTFAELAHADFDGGHRDAPHPECTLMCTHLASVPGFAGFADSSAKCGRTDLLQVQYLTGQAMVNLGKAICWEQIAASCQHIA